MDHQHLVQKRILTLTVVEQPMSQLANPMMRREAYEFWKLCKTPMTQNCNGLLARRPELSQHADLFMIKDLKHDQILFAFRVFDESSLAQMSEQNFDPNTRKYLKAGYRMVDYVKFHPSTENNPVLRNMLYEMFLGNLYHYCLQRNITRLMTVTTRSTFANKLLFRFGFMPKRGESHLLLDSFFPDARYFAQMHQTMWRDRVEIASEISA